MSTQKNKTIIFSYCCNLFVSILLVIFFHNLLVYPYNPVLNGSIRTKGLITDICCMYEYNNICLKNTSIFGNDIFKLYDCYTQVNYSVNNTEYNQNISKKFIFDYKNFINKNVTIDIDENNNIKFTHLSFKSGFYIIFICFSICFLVFYNDL